MSSENTKKTLSLPHRYLPNSLHSFSNSERNSLKESDDEEEDVDFLKRNDRQSTDHLSCVTIHSPKRPHFKLGEVALAGKHGLWRKQPKTRVAKLEKQLRAKWAMEEHIEEQLSRFSAQYNHSGGRILPKDIPQMMMPEWATPLEMAVLGWMGDWRPSSFLQLLRSLARVTTFSFSDSSSDQASMDRTLSQLIREIRIEETVLDEEMGEIQSTCILHLPFGPGNRIGGSPIDQVLSEFKKIERVLSKAQQLRFKVLELIVKKVLNQSDAAEFLVMFGAIQDSIRQFCSSQKSQKVPVSLPPKYPEKDAIWEPSILRRFSNLSAERGSSNITDATRSSDL